MHYPAHNKSVKLSLQKAVAMRDHMLLLLVLLLLQAPAAST
jgi:hypothetical protein